MNRPNRKKSGHSGRCFPVLISGLLLIIAAELGILLWLWSPWGAKENREAPAAAANRGSVTKETDPEREREEPASDAEQTPSVTEETHEAWFPGFGETSGPDDPVTEEAKRIMEDMTLEEKIYQLFIVRQETITGYSLVTQSGDASRQAIENYPVGGIVYFGENIVDRDQCTDMISSIQDYSGLGLFIAVDEEGGTVARVGGNENMGTTDFPPMGEIGQTGDTDEAYQVGYTIGSDISELGFNLDFAPVADVNSNPDNPVIGTRSFHEDPEIAADMVAACVEGFDDSGVLCTLKHFPGHGDTATDSHYGAAETDKTLEELMECEMLPFISGIEAGAPFVMIGHISVPEVTGNDVPATLSYDIVTGLLRKELDFDGLIVTDSMEMQAICGRYSSGEAAVMALQAGVDIILMPDSLSGAVSGIQDAIDNGTLTEERIDESVLRILEMKLRSGIIE